MMTMTNTATTSPLEEDFPQDDSIIWLNDSYTTWNYVNCLCTIPEEDEAKEDGISSMTSFEVTLEQIKTVNNPTRERAIPHHGLSKPHTYLLGIEPGSTEIKERPVPEHLKDSWAGFLELLESEDDDHDETEGQEQQPDESSSFKAPDDLGDLDAQHIEKEPKTSDSLCGLDPKALHISGSGDPHEGQVEVQEMPMTPTTPGEPILEGHGSRASEETYHFKESVLDEDEEKYQDQDDDLNVNLCQSSTEILVDIILDGPSTVEEGPRSSSWFIPLGPDHAHPSETEEKVSLEKIHDLSPELEATKVDINSNLNFNEFSNKSNNGARSDSSSEDSLTLSLLSLTSAKALKIKIPKKRRTLTLRWNITIVREFLRGVRYRIVSAFLSMVPRRCRRKNKVTPIISIIPHSKNDSMEALFSDSTSDSDT